MSAKGGEQGQRLTVACGRVFGPRLLKNFLQVYSTDPSQGIPSEPFELSAGPGRSMLGAQGWKRRPGRKPATHHKLWTNNNSLASR